MLHRRRTLRLVIMIIVGFVATLVTGLFGEWTFAPTVGWCFSSAIYSAWVWIAIRGKDGAETEKMAGSEEPARSIADALVVVLSVASLFAVAFVLVQAHQTHGAAKVLLAVLALASVALSWILLHTLFTLRYAVIYYNGPNGGIDFNQPDKPGFSDFAYLAFVLGMTYQVSDTNITSHAMRVVVLRHSLLSFVFGAVILASSINLMVGLSS